MSDENQSTETVEKQTDQNTNDVEKQAFLDRLNKESAKRKDAEKRATDVESQMAELKAAMEERDQAGLPELERERKRVEQLEKRAIDAEKRAEETERNLTRSTRSSLVTAAAAKAGFDDPSDALRFNEYVNLDEIEDASDAERAVKKLAKAKPRLLADQEPVLPGRVIKDGDPVAKANVGMQQIDEDTAVVVDGLKKFLATRN